jgi:CopG antitoxin of type II toxin-antitoxin system
MAEDRSSISGAQS